jgi:Ca2+-transporting ATPase
MPTEDVAQHLRVNPGTGLASAEAAQREAQYGPNAIHERPRRPPWRIFIDQFTDVMILVLLAAAVIAGLVGEPEDTVAIAIIVLLNGVLGFIQEYRAERAIAALKTLAATHARKPTINHATQRWDIEREESDPQRDHPKS